MRQYIFYADDGALLGCELRVGGWPPGADPRDPKTQSRVAQIARKNRIEQSPDFAGWVPYDCPCSTALQACQCSLNLIQNHYYNGKVLFPKPELTVAVEGVVVNGSSNIAPGAVAELIIRAAAPDGHTVLIKNTAGGVLLGDGPVTVSFSGGASAPVELTGPPQGVTHYIQWGSKYVRTDQLAIRGWA